MEDAGTAYVNVNMELNKKIENIEKELHILKGSIKKLIIDIREEMNNYENPFLNLQQFQVQAPREDMKDLKDVDENSKEDLESQPVIEPSTTSSELKNP